MDDKNEMKNTPVYNPVTWSAKYVSVNEFAKGMGLSPMFIRALCRERKIHHIRQGARKFMIDAQRAMTDLEALGDSEMVVFTDVRSVTQPNRKVKRHYKEHGRKNTQHVQESQFIDSAIADAIGA